MDFRRNAFELGEEGVFFGRVFAALDAREASVLWLGVAKTGTAELSFVLKGVLAGVLVPSVREGPLRSVSGVKSGSFLREAQAVPSILEEIGVRSLGRTVLGPFSEHGAKLFLNGVFRGTLLGELETSSVVCLLWIT